VVNAANEATTMRFPAILDVKDDERFTGEQMLLDTGFPAFFRITQAPFPFASSLILHRDKQPDLPPEGFRILARSTPKTARETGDVADLRPTRQWATQDPFAQYNIAAVVEGPLRSAFGAPTGAQKTPARVLVVSSSQFFANPFARSGSPRPGSPGGDEVLQQLALPYAMQILTNSILVAKNTLDWMTMDGDLAVCASLPN
jgi:hypothetical protein